jgi:hypothetical protein
MSTLTILIIRHAECLTIRKRRGQATVSRRTVTLMTNPW